MNGRLPKGWLATTIGDVANVVTGKTPPTAQAHLFEGDLPFVKPGDLDGPRHLTTTESTIAPTAFEFVPRLPEGSVLISCIGNLGKTAILGREGSCNQQLNAVLPTSAALPEFLYAWATTIRPWLDANSSATTVSIINKGRFLGAPLALPPVNEQRRIVAKLETLQSHSRRAREALDTVPPLLEKMRQSILAAAFRGDLTKDWRAKHKDVEPASELLKRIRVERRKRWEEAELAKMKTKGKAPKDDKWTAKYKDPEPVDATGLPDLPEGWCWASVSELAEIRLGRQRSPQRAQGPNMRPYMRAANVTWAGISTSDVKEMDFNEDELGAYRLVRGDVLLSEASGSPTEVGKPAIWNDEIENCCFQNTLIRVRPRGLTGEYLLLHFTADVRLGRFAHVGKGVGINHLGADRMYGWPIAVAPIDEQAALQDALAQSLARLDTLERQLDEAVSDVNSLDGACLVKAFRGELVAQDPHDEPADAMLARMQTTNGAAVKTERKARGEAPT